MRPETPLAVENGVGKPAAYEAPNVGTGKRAWRTPIPHLSLLNCKVGQGLIVLGGARSENTWPAGVALPNLNDERGANHAVP